MTRPPGSTEPELCASSSPWPRSEISVAVTVTVIAAPAGFDGVHVTTRG
ncbi:MULTISPECIES: hypothetical protein [unclassified Streptomyces]